MRGDDNETQVNLMRAGQTKLKGGDPQGQEVKLSETRGVVCFHNETGSTNERKTKRHNLRNNVRRIIQISSSIRVWVCVSHTSITAPYQSDEASATIWSFIFLLNQHFIKSDKVSWIPIEFLLDVFSLPAPFSLVKLFGFFYSNRFNCVFSLIKILPYFNSYYVGTVSPVSWVYRTQRWIATEDHGEGSCG